MSIFSIHKHLYKENEGVVCLCQTRKVFRLVLGDNFKANWSPPSNPGVWIDIPQGKLDAFMEAVGENAKMDVLNV